MTGRVLAGQSVRYLFVGAYNVLFTLAAFWLLETLWGDDVGVQAVYWVSALLGVLNGFISQRLFVWRSRGAWHGELLKFLAVNVIVALANSALLFLTVTLWGLPAFPSQVAITAVLVVLAFFANRTWVFGAKSRTTDRGLRPHRG
jgi:putative flippase GtrA